MDFNKYIICFDKMGRFAEKRSFSYEQRSEAATYFYEMKRKGYTVDEVKDRHVYDSY